MRSTVAEGCPNTDCRHRGYVGWSSGDLGFALEKADVVSDSRGGNQPRTALGDRAETTGPDLLIDHAAAHREHDHGISHPVELSAGHRHGSRQVRGTVHPQHSLQRLM